MSMQESASARRIDMLLKENALLRQDAERYRWLRSQHWNSSAICTVTDPKKSLRLGSFCPSLEQLDYSGDSGIAIEDMAAGGNDEAGQ